MVRIQDKGKLEVIKGCRPSAKYKRYFDRTNKLYFENSLASAKVYTAPLLKITSLSQDEAEFSKDGKWIDGGHYGLLALDEFDETCLILDRGTSIFHPIFTYQTVLHEQIHMYVTPYAGHGKIYKAQVRRIAALGALDRLI